MKTKPIDRLKDITAPTGTETHLDITFPDSRPRFTIAPLHAVMLIGAVVLIGIGIVTATLLSRPPEPVAAVVEEEEAPSADIVVSVVGAVAEPGLVTLAPGARIADAITAAGGLVPEAEPHALNQAQLLVDGQQIHVPDTLGPPTEAGVEAGGVDTSGKVSLNSADTAALMTLKGVGESTAAAIISYREENGGFSTLEQLMEVSGIGPAKYAAMESQITL